MKTLSSEEMSPRKLVVAIASILIFCSALVLVINAYRFGFLRASSQGFALGLVCLLGASMVHGWNPGRWIGVIYAGIAGITSLLAAFTPAFGAQSPLWIGSLGVIYLGCAVGLLSSNAGLHFQKEEPDELEEESEAGEDEEEEIWEGEPRAEGDGEADDGPDESEGASR